MKIPQPTRRTAGRPLRFWAICPGCWRLLACDDGRWPLHQWDAMFGDAACYMGGKLHESLEVKSG